MKKILMSLATLLLVVNFIGCSSDSTTSGEKQVVEAMVIDENYTLAIGDKINRLSDDATIEITQNSQDSDTFYTLLEGEAEILRK